MAQTGEVIYVTVAVAFSDIFRWRADICCDAVPVSFEIVMPGVPATM